MTDRLNNDRYERVVDDGTGLYWTSRKRDHLFVTRIEEWFVRVVVTRCERCGMTRENAGPTCPGRSD